MFWMLRLVNARLLRETLHNLTINALAAQGSGRSIKAQQQALRKEIRLL